MTQCLIQTCLSCVRIYLRIWEWGLTDWLLKIIASTSGLGVMVLLTAKLLIFRIDFLFYWKPFTVYMLYRVLSSNSEGQIIFSFNHLTIKGSWKTNFGKVIILHILYSFFNHFLFTFPQKYNLRNISQVYLYSCNSNDNYLYTLHLSAKINEIPQIMYILSSSAW